MTRILAISGSLSAASSNTALLQQMKAVPVVLVDATARSVARMVEEL